MIRILFDGRLGNNLFQYAAGRALASLHQTKLVGDLSIVCGGNNRKSTVIPDIFCLFNRLQSASLWSDRISMRLFGKQSWQLKKQIIYRDDNNGDCFDPAFFSLPNGSVLVGFFQNRKYFQSVEKEIREELLEKGSTVVPGLASQQRIGIHIRRGDYCLEQLGNWRVCELDYYSQALALLEAKVGRVPVHVFSDDPDWCRRSFKHPSMIFHAGNSPLADFFELSRCNYQIISNSTFSWWTGWLNPTPGKIIVSPDHWTKDDCISINSKRFPGMLTLAELAR